ncbi:flagellin [Halonotius sp. F2-221B]|jgi:archaellin|uniref:archaellin/type IV pilin N-terminal domain-containing protein n=1 Tax=Halonotius sp. F2-221B TaxID=2731620 RepID=UPI00398AABF9
MFSTGSRGQVGTGTLLVFISVVLVAGATAGVVTNTAGFLQYQSDQTSESSTAEVSDRLEVAYSVGVVDGTTAELDGLELIVKPAADATAIELDNTTVEYRSPEGVTTLVSNGSQDATGPTFTVEPLQGDAADGVLSDPSDRAKLAIELDGETAALESLRRGEAVELTLTTDSGADTQVQHTVPAVAPDDGAVKL